MKYLKSAATTLATASCIIYVLFLWAPVYSIFPAAFVVLVKQITVLAFCAAVFVNPDGVIRTAEKLAPKVIDIIQVIFNSKNKNGTD